MTRSGILEKNYSRGTELLCSALLQRGWSQAQLGSEVGISVGYVSRIVSGKRRPGLQVGVLIHRVLGIALDAWLEPPANLNTGAARRKRNAPTIDSSGRKPRPLGRGGAPSL
jgi:transcriptional regulator with XRE-family HTH domain